MVQGMGYKVYGVKSMLLTQAGIDFSACDKPQLVVEQLLFYLTPYTLYLVLFFTSRQKPQGLPDQPFQCHIPA